MIRILEIDDYLTMATKIYFNFEVNQSCTVRGFIKFEDGDVKPKGEMVLDQIRLFDTADNVDKHGRRKRKKVENSIGDFVASKIFCFDKRIHDKKIIYQIWRKQ